ncbi:quinone-dependent dihydroorotate dehydrogenase [Rubritalea marina]|uniref:quinone-dependent dihydroorotate dehydrogenase n=1 Tax=Rubritalea marina TaxID=361055 RepID=UPI000376E613|nr:quinone-dependent dihydroorotate dehydrogenase [Rubritalea marina]
MTPSQYQFARNLLFKLDAETAHHVSLDLLKTAEKVGLLKFFSSKPPQSEPVECMGLQFPNPVGLAAGLDKEGAVIDALGRLGFGSVEIGTITPKPQPGNPKPRLFRIVEEEAIINRMGFNNVGIEQGVANVKSSKTYQGIVGFNIGKNKVTPNEFAIDDYTRALRGCWGVADYVTINISSPNTPGLRDLQAADDTARLLEAVKKQQASLEEESGVKMPIALKVAPDMGSEQIEELSKVFLNGGLEGLVATNTTISREAVLGRPHAQEAGGLSGRPVTQRSTEVIAEFYSHLGKEIPIIGVGGIMTPEDAIEKFDAGARIVQLYTGFIYHGPPLVHAILNKLASK